MIAVIIFIILLGLALRPHYLYSFDNVPGRIILLSVVVYLAQANPLLGLVAVVVVARVLDRTPASTAHWNTSPDLLKIEHLMRPKSSFDSPTLRGTDVPVNDPFSEYTVF
jgi:hypothetical protein